MYKTKKKSLTFWKVEIKCLSIKFKFKFMREIVDCNFFGMKYNLKGYK